MIKEAHRSHPAVMDGDRYHGNSQYGGRAHVEAMFGAELPELEGKPAEYTFTPEAVDRVFNIVTLEAYGAGLWSDKVTDLAATSRRLASCSLRRGANEGTIRLWDLPQALICEVSDNTMIDDVLAGGARWSRATAMDCPPPIASVTSFSCAPLAPGRRCDSTCGSSHVHPSQHDRASKIKFIRPLPIAKIKPHHRCDARQLIKSIHAQRISASTFLSAVRTLKPQGRDSRSSRPPGCT